MVFFFSFEGYSYRFRIINAGVEYCPIEMIIYNHKMKVIGTDGFDIELVEGNSLNFILFPLNR